MVINFQSSIDTFTIVNEGSYFEFDSDVILNGPSVSYDYDHPQTTCSTPGNTNFFLQPGSSDSAMVCAPGQYGVERGD